MLESILKKENYNPQPSSDEIVSLAKQSVSQAKLKPKQKTTAQLLKFSSILAPTLQVVSRQRVADYGEVYTNPREVNAMLDLVKPETERVDSTFLEPACGTGNFLVEILSRKMAVVARQYQKSQLEYERAAVLAISSLYGIDILAENVTICHARLFEVFNSQYSALFKTKCKQACRHAVRHLLKINILQGDTLGFKTSAGKPIIFSEWKFPFNDSRLQRRDYLFEQMRHQADGLVPPVKSYPPAHFLVLGDAE
ncbi:MAG: hypothetical protein PHY16_18280 [Methylobacter sp.]|nr:hypothetical protein [Methylobacter sp.]